jgi:hypothetical protein
MVHLPVTTDEVRDLLNLIRRNLHCCQRARPDAMGSKHGSYPTDDALYRKPFDNVENLPLSGPDFFRNLGEWLLRKRKIVLKSIE